MSLKLLLILCAIAGGVVAVIFFIMANGQDTEWGLASWAISWTLALLTVYLLPAGTSLTIGGRKETNAG